LTFLLKSNRIARVILPSMKILNPTTLPFETEWLEPVSDEQYRVI
jgi:hypothetical protein